MRARRRLSDLDVVRGSFRAEGLEFQKALVYTVFTRQIRSLSFVALPFLRCGELTILAAMFVFALALILHTALPGLWYVGPLFSWARRHGLPLGWSWCPSGPGLGGTGS